LKVTYFFRKPYPGAYSIEELFSSIGNYLQQNEKKIQSEFINVPHYSKSLKCIWDNIRFAGKYQSAINHVTGDIHYVLLGLNRKNYNILTIHDCAVLYRKSKWSPYYWIFKYLWVKWPVARASVVTTISEKTKADIVHFSGCHPDKVVVIPNPVNPVFKTSLPVPGNKTPRILQVGTAANKNLERVITALRGVDCVLDIIGPLSHTQRNQMNTSGIRFENRSNLSIKEVARHYEQADLVIFASTFEGFGMPIIEANTVGRPVITSQIAPMLNVAGDGALLVNPEDPGSIRQAILRVINDQGLYKSLVDKGLKNAAGYDIQNVSEKYLRIYNPMKDTKPKSSAVGQK